MEHIGWGYEGGDWRRGQWNGRPANIVEVGSGCTMCEGGWGGGFGELMGLG